MGYLRRWLAKLILGYDPSDFKDYIESYVDGLCMEVAELKQTIARTSDESWRHVAQNAIMNLEKRIDMVKGVVVQHQQHFDEFFVEDEPEDLTIEFPVDKKDIN